MDRLPHLRVARAATVAALGAGLLLFGGGCPDDEPQVSTRVNAVSAGRPTGGAGDGFCDVVAAPGTGRRLSLPPLAGEKTPKKQQANRWRWINVWATWCKPCVAELPLLQRWPRRLTSAGVDVSLMMLSVDSSPQKLRAFARRHRGMPETARMADPKALGGWLASYGLDRDTSIPVHLFVAPTGRVRCIRAGTLSSSDFPRVAAVLSK